MTRTEFQTSHLPQDRRSDTRVLAFSTGAPTVGIGPAAPTRREAPPAEHHGWRTAVIGATGLALLVAAMGGIAYYRAQEAVTTTEAVAEVTIPLSTYDSQVPEAAGVMVPLSVYASQVPALASRELVVIPESTYASQVPARATVEDVAIPLSTVRSQVPEEAGVMIPRSTLESQVPEAAR